MAADTKQSTPNIGGNGFIWLLLAAAGTYFVAHQLPLEGSRPPTSEAIIAQRAGVQDVEARLWQDPFAAVAGVLARSPELKPENCQAAAINDGIKRHCQSPLNESALEGPLRERLLVMVACVRSALFGATRIATTHTLCNPRRFECRGVRATRRGTCRLLLARRGYAGRSAAGAVAQGRALRVVRAQVEA